MCQKISLAFYKNLIISDFLLIRKKYKNSKNFLSSFLQVTIANNLVCLNFLETIKSLKQFINLILFLKENNAVLLFYILNKQYRILLQHYFSGQMTISNLLFISNLQFQLPEKYCMKIQTIEEDFDACLKFFSSFGFVNFSSFFKAIQQQIFLFFTVHTKITHGNFGEYKLFNEVSEIQKVIFLVLIVKQILQKTLI